MSPIVGASCFAMFGSMFKIMGSYANRSRIVYYAIPDEDDGVKRVGIGGNSLLFPSWLKGRSLSSIGTLCYAVSIYFFASHAFPKIKTAKWLIPSTIFVLTTCLFEKAAYHYKTDSFLITKGFYWVAEVISFLAVVFLFYSIAKAKNNATGDLSSVVVASLFQIPFILAKFLVKPIICPAEAINGHLRDNFF